MATKVRFNWATSANVFAVFRNDSGQVYYISGDVMETWGTSSRTANDYDVQATSYTGAYHIMTIPSTLDAGRYVMQIFEGATETPVDGDVADVIGSFDLVWDGAAIVTLDSLLVGGDNLVTLTIRTSGSVALSGVQIWLSTDGNRENAVTAVQVTNDSGVVTFFLDFTTYHIHAKLAGYTFVASSFTAASGSVSFTKDIGTLISAGADSDYSDSFITRALQVCRKFISAPTINKNYSDNYLIRRMEAAYGLILGEKQRNQDRPIVATVEITIVSGQNDYQIPATLGPIVSVYSSVDSASRFKLFYYDHSPFHYGGQGVWVEGNLLRLNTGFNVTGTIKVEALPNGTARLHRGTCTINSDGDEVTFGASPNKGSLDTTVNGYAASLLRILKVTGTTIVGNNVQQMPIRSYNAVTRVATLAAPLSPIPSAVSNELIFYEIMPQFPIGLDMLPALYTAWEISNTEGMRDRARGTKDTYNNNLRHLRLQAFYSRIDTAQLVEDDSYLNGGHGHGLELVSSISGVP